MICARRWRHYPKTKTATHFALIDGEKWPLCDDCATYWKATHKRAKVEAGVA